MEFQNLPLNAFLKLEGEDNDDSLGRRWKFLLPRWL